MAFCFELFVRSFLLLACITICTATIQTMTTTFTKKKSLSTSYTTLQNISKIRCVAKCNRDSQVNCTLAGYDEATKTCYLSVDDPQNAVNTTDDMHGVFFYEPQPAGPTVPPVPVPCVSAGDPLLDGVSPVPDSYFTASSEYDINHKAYFARLSDGGPGWLASDAEVNANPPAFYLQVQLLGQNTVERVATRGGNAFWTTGFRLAYSVDCVNFNNLVDGNGNDIVFSANNDDNTLVENQLPTLITALCVRFHISAWHSVPYFHAEIYGCPSV